jgi:hypothetical protein
MDREEKKLRKNTESEKNDSAREAYETKKQRSTPKLKT